MMTNGVGAEVEEQPKVLIRLESDDSKKLNLSLAQVQKMW